MWSGLADDQKTTGPYGKVGLNAQTGHTRAGVALGLRSENFDVSPIRAGASAQVEQGKVMCVVHLLGAIHTQL